MLVSPGMFLVRVDANAEKNETVLVKYSSRKLDRAEKTSTFEVQSTAVIFALRTFRICLLSALFTFYVNRKAVIFHLTRNIFMPDS